MTTATALGPAVDIGESVIDRARRGDQEAFAAVIRHYDPGLSALTFRLLGDRDLMDDVLQEAYVKAFRALPRFRGDAKLGTWLYRIAYNACVDELRRSRRGQELPLDEALPERERRSRRRRGRPRRPRAGAGRSAAGRARGRPPRRRAGLRLPGGARVLGIPEGTVASRLNRARASLRMALGTTG